MSLSLIIELKICIKFLLKLFKNEPLKLSWPKNNFNKVALKLQKLIDDKGLRLKIGNAGKLRIMKKISIDRMIVAYKSIYKGVLHES